MKLHPYQEEAVAFLRERSAAALFLDMGLGKTAISLSALEPRHLPALVVAPKRVTENVWEEERLLWRPDLSLRVAAGPPAARQAALRSEADLVAISRDNIADAEPYADRFKTLILDELSGFKGRGVRWKSAKRIGNVIPNRWGLTGTPSPNGLLDLWAELYLLDRGATLGPRVTAFRERYFTEGRRLPNGVVSSWDIRPGADSRIHALVEPLCLSMGTEGRVDLPPITYNRVKVTLPLSARKVYDEMLADFVTYVELIGYTAANAAVASGKLAQIAAGFLYDDDQTGAYTILHTAKLDALAEIVEATDSPLLVFYKFKAELDQLKKRYPKASLVADPGIIGKWNQGKVPILLAHPASAGHGLNLQHGGHTAVWTSLDWSLEYWQQANKRLARQGQKHPVVIHTLEAVNTVDAAIARRLDTKESVQDALMNYLEIM